MEDIILAVKEQYPQGIIVAVAVLIMVWLLKKNLFEPVVAILAKRQSDKEELEYEAGASTAEGERLGEERRQGLLDARNDAMMVKADARGKAQDEARGILDEVAGRLGKVRQEKSDELEQELAAARDSMSSDIPLMAKQIAERILQRQIG